MTESTLYFSRAGRAGADDILVRSPELRALREKTIALFGVGCLGAPSALEFARAGIGELRILDHDIVDPATIGRWPFGLSAAGLAKVDVIRDAIRRDYPTTKVRPYNHRLGRIRAVGSDLRSDHDVLDEMTEGTSLFYDATAELGVQHFLSDLARERGIPYVGVVGTNGGWGGKVFRIWPDRTEGCWLCYRCACDDGTIPEPPSDPRGEVQPRGCADPTFTGASFDLVHVAIMGIRLAVSILCDGQEGGYPPLDCDVLVVALRDEAGKAIAPRVTTYKIAKHPQCERCNSQ